MSPVIGSDETEAESHSRMCRERWIASPQNCFRQLRESRKLTNNTKRHSYRTPRNMFPVLGFALLLVICHGPLVGGEGKFWLRLVSYDNPGGKGANGHCCDGRSIFCEIRGCDHYFHICVDNFNGNDDIASCALGTRHSGATRNHDYITFGEDIGGLANPILFNFQTWRGGVKIKVKVWDDDNNNDDHVDDLSRRQFMYAAASETQATTNTLLLESRTTLEVQLKAWCDQNWFGPRCDTYCQPDPLHHRCNPDTGSKICLPGWTGDSCDVDVDECSSAPCASPGGSCVNLVDSFRCECDPGYTGVACEVDLDECASQPCLNAATCRDQPTAYQCVCKPGYTGIQCETDVDECYSQPCQHGSTCTDDVNHFRCACLEGYDGLQCEQEVNECSSNPCQNEAVCEDGISEFTCLCPAGFEGFTCEINVNECESSPCHGDQSQCIDVVDGFICACPAGFTGTTCHSEINECDSQPCQNGANCTDVINGFHCSCIDGWEGLHCEVNIDDCVNVTCGENMVCVDGVDAFNCTCSPGWMGGNCSVNIDECASNPCPGGATCFDMVDGFECACAYGLSGSLCEKEVDFCDSQPCMNNGTCVPQFGSFSCNCSANWTGVTCEQNTEPCFSNPCGPQATCNVTDTGGYDCICVDGWSSPNCTARIPSCADFPCHNNATCENLTVGFVCHCHPGISGPLCDVTHTADNTSLNCACEDNSTAFNCCDACVSAPCQNGGLCESHKEGDYTCECQPRFTGTNCEISLTPVRPSLPPATVDRVDSSALLFLGRLPITYTSRVSDVICNITADYFSLRPEEVSIDFRISTCHGDKESVVSVFIFKVRVEDRVLSYALVDAVFGSLDDRQVAALFPLPMYIGEECEDLTVPGTQSPPAWLDRFWWVLVIVCLAFIILVLGIYAYLRHIRSWVWQPENVKQSPVYADSEAVLPDHQPSSPALNGALLNWQVPGDPLYFENQTYEEIQPVEGDA